MRRKTKTATEEPWRGELILNRDGAPKVLLANAMLALRSASDWRGVLAFNEFTLTTELRSQPPWNRSNSGHSPRAWTARDDALTTEWLQRAGIHVGLEIAGQAVETVARETSSHPVQEYLEGLAWDCEPRVDGWLATYLGADYPAARSGDYLRAVGRCFLVGGVARIYRPGCKADCVLILEGRQGALKSSALNCLAKPWFTDELPELGTKDAALQTRGVWIIEMSELESMHRGEISRVKAFLSRSTDRFRPPYGKRTIEAPRQCIFAGTVNSDSYLRDETGNRRFWPVRCGHIDIDRLGADRDQLWAEARALYEAGERWWLDDRGLVVEAEQQQAQRYQGDPWDDVIDDFLKGRWTVSVPEILTDALEIQPARQDQVAMNRVVRSLKAMGWERHQYRDGGKREWRYRRPDHGAADEEDTSSNVTILSAE